MEQAPLWRNRDFMLMQSGQLLSTFGSSLSGIAYPLLALVLTGSAAKTGYVGAVELAPIVLLSVAAGLAADRFDRRRLMICSDVLGASAVGVLAAAVLTHHAVFWLVLAVAFADTTASVVFRAGNSGAFKAVVPAAQLADASSVSMARTSTVRLTAPPVGGARFASVIDRLGSCRRGSVPRAATGRRPALGTARTTDPTTAGGTGSAVGVPGSPTGSP